MQEKVSPARRTISSVPKSPDAFAHAVLRTSRYDEMIAWYRCVLNARVVFRNDMLCFLTYDGEHHRVAILNVPDLKEQDQATNRLAHLAYSYNEMGDLLATYKRLKLAGILPFRPINHGPTVSLYYKDPDGTAIELQVDAFESKEEAEQFMLSDDFRKNPIGVTIDPDALLAAWEAGTPEVELKKRPNEQAAARQG